MNVLLSKHTRREFRRRVESGELRGCIIPVGATEQHLEHLAMEHDIRTATHVATAVAERLAPAVVVAASISIGISEHHMRHPGTLSATPGAWLGLLADTISSVHRAGIGNILVLNGHGGNIAPVEGVWSQLLQRFETNLHFRSYWEFLPRDVAAANLSTDAFPGHAQEFETATALALFPENVRPDAMADQADRSPLAASAEAGRRMIDAIIDETARFVGRMISGDETASIPPFFP